MTAEIEKLIAEAEAAHNSAKSGPWEVRHDGDGWAVNGGVDFCWPIHHGGHEGNARFFEWAYNNVPALITALQNLLKANNAMQAENERFWTANLALQRSRDAAEAKLAEVTGKYQHASAMADAFCAKLDAAEATVATLTAQVEAMRGAGRDAAESWQECLGHVVSALGEKPDWYDAEITAIADFLAALTTEKTNG